MNPEETFTSGIPLPPTYDPKRAGANDAAGNVYNPPRNAKKRDAYHKAWDRAFVPNA